MIYAPYPNAVSLVLSRNSGFVTRTRKSEIVALPLQFSHEAANLKN